MKVVAIVQARMGSTRLPGKVMKPIYGMPIIEILLARLSRARKINQIVLATSTKECDTPLVEHVEGLGYQCVRGSEHDVLGRYLTAAKQYHAEVIVRITGDCPLIDPELVDQVISDFKSSDVDYFNLSPTHFPNGLDTEVCSFFALEQAARETQLPFDREHVTPYLQRSPQFKCGSLSYPKNLSALRWTIDEAADYAVLKKVFEHFTPDIHFSWKAVLELQTKHPDRFAANEAIIRNEGASLGTGQKLWKRAQSLIPGGNMLLSKRAEHFLPQHWPAYFSRAKGCAVWDLEDKQYTDLSIMGVGTHILGYGQDEVDAAVRKAVDAGNLSTLNCPEEVYLAEKLIELHPWADRVHLARTGGEANAVAIRIARAASGRDKVAVCGYHGWHDWYLAANLDNNDHLMHHLLPGLNPKGVPCSLRDTVFPFSYNDYEAVETLVSHHDIGAIIMEVMRNKEPKHHFLQKVRKLATDRDIVLIFDECTSGFRQTLGGLHKLYDVEPDMAVFGKALGNGYAITATLGRRDIMEAAQSTFISSTFWTERIGPAAALKTLEVMERMQSWEIVTQIGLSIRKRWQQLADQHGLHIEHWGLPALSGYTVKSLNALAYKTLITQEMLAKGFLASDRIYVSTEHNREVVDRYFEALSPLFALIKECEDGRDIRGLLKGPVCHAGLE